MRFPRGMIQLHLAHTRGDDKDSEQHFFLNYNSILPVIPCCPCKVLPMQLNKVKAVTAPMLEAFVNILYSELCECSMQPFFSFVDVMKYPSLQCQFQFKKKKEGKSQGAQYGMCISVQSNSHAIMVQKFLHRQSRASRSILVMEKPIYSAPLLRLFLQHIFSQML